MPRLVFEKPLPNDVDKRIELRSGLWGSELVGLWRRTLEGFCNGFTRVPEIQGDFSLGEPVDQNHSANQFIFKHVEHPGILRCEASRFRDRNSSPHRHPQVTPSQTTWLPFWLPKWSPFSLPSPPAAVFKTVSSSGRVTSVSKALGYRSLGCRSEHFAFSSYGLNSYGLNAYFSTA